MTRLTDEEIVELKRLCADEEDSVFGTGVVARLLAEREEMRREVEAKVAQANEFESAYVTLQAETDRERDTSRARVATLEAALRAALYELSHFMPTTAGETITRIEDALEGKAGTP